MKRQNLVQSILGAALVVTAATAASAQPARGDTFTRLGCFSY
jgi:hypothetical protein